MACLYKHMIIYMLVACLFQVGGGRAAPDSPSISVEVPETTYMGSILGSMASGLKSAVRRVAETADVASESGKNMAAFLHRMNESAVNFGTGTANRMGQMVKNGSRRWSGIFGNLFSSE